MQKFSEAYAKARDVVTTQTFSSDWQAFLKNEAKITALLQVDAPDTAHADGLDKLRRKLDKDSRNALVAFFVGGGRADKIIEAATNGAKDAKVAERAATIKLLKHLYLASKRGGQDVWVCATPEAYSKWIFDEIDAGNMKSKLGKDSEVYSAGDRKRMCDALQLALKWSQDAVRKLADGKPDAQAVVKRWFADEDTTDPQITTAMGKLKDGFKKIADVCNSGKLVFSDHPPDRANGGWKDWAFVYRQEPMNVVYLQGAFLKSGSSGKLWMCALTIIHELSHREVGTDDNAYDHDGLKPAKDKLPHAKALNNADSWAYFCLDLAGVLAAGDRNRVLA